ncbi:hypothetical protein M378DRAFT_18435 [Amanita muscaria Koide BX008]|uniref:Uncharacterized protein n=1 Tax=Amanita muscaria (strain Koide BX008) TaxID=946122 RepID=A0A0C2WFL2_AMAMK|nr:hypothetical protein M378DRAFT_18435 [Amanita muscaria Koide BX008]
MNHFLANFLDSANPKLIDKNVHQLKDNRHTGTQERPYIAQITTVIELLGKVLQEFISQSPQVLPLFSTSTSLQALLIASCSPDFPIDASSDTLQKRRPTLPVRFVPRVQLFYAPPPVIILLLGVNGNPQPLVDANPDGNIVSVVDEAGVAETTRSTEDKFLGRLRKKQQQQQAVLLEQPRLYDMDLERMHDELYRGRYLTPQYSAKCRGFSILEFDLALRMECQRMTVRERERRRAPEEKREAKEKEDVAQLLLLQNGNVNSVERRSEAGGDAFTDSPAAEERDDEETESKRPQPGALDGQGRVDELDIIDSSPVPSPKP